MVFMLPRFFMLLWFSASMLGYFYHHLIVHTLYAQLLQVILFVCVEVLWPSQPNGVMSSAVSLPNHMFTGQA